MKNPVWPSSCVTPAGTSNELDVQNEWEENTHTHTQSATLVHATMVHSPTVMNGIFWTVIGHTLVHATVVISPHGKNAQYFSDGNRPLFWYILLRHSATTVKYGIYFFCFCVTPACVWCCDASTFTEHENHQTSSLNMKYCTPENTIKGRLQITGRHSQPTGNDHKQELRPPMSTDSSPARATPPDVQCFTTRVQSR